MSLNEKPTTSLSSSTKDEFEANTSSLNRQPFTEEELILDKSCVRVMDLTG